MKDLFLAQSARPANLKEINLSRLRPFHRLLLVTDGTVTRSIEAYTLCPVEIVVLHQERQTLPTEDVWLQLGTGAQVIARQVILQTRKKRAKPIVHTYATSLIVHQRLPEVIREGLDVEGEGLGRLLQRSGLQTRRDLLWCGVECCKDLPSALHHLQGKPFLSRTYRIVVDGQPIARINEKFPLGEAVE